MTMAICRSAFWRICAASITLLAGISLGQEHAQSDPIDFENDSNRRIPSNADRLIREGFSVDDEGLLAAALDPRSSIRGLAYNGAYDLSNNVLIDIALQELAVVEDLSHRPSVEAERFLIIAVKFDAARYLDQQGRAEGTDYLRQLASFAIVELNHSPATSRVMGAVRILAEKGDESFAPQITACLEQAWPAEAVSAAQALAVFPNPTDHEVERAWIAATERLSAFLQTDDPQVHNGARLYATWLSDSVRKQTVVTQRIKDAFDAIVLPPDRDDEQGRIARSLESARTHWATCELVPSEEPPPAEQPADPPPTDPE